MGVIRLFPERPPHRAYFYVPADGSMDVIAKWFHESETPNAERITFANFIDIYQANGLIGIEPFVVEFEYGLYGLQIKRKGGTNPCPIFCRGPFDPAREITFLAGAFFHKKTLRPYAAIGSARDNLETLVGDRARRRGEPTSY